MIHVLECDITSDSIYVWVCIKSISQLGSLNLTQVSLARAWLTSGCCVFLCTLHGAGAGGAVGRRHCFWPGGATCLGGCATQQDFNHVRTQINR